MLKSFQRERGLIHVKLHFIVIILGFSAIFGKLIHLDASGLVFFRTLIAVIFMLLWAFIMKYNFFSDKKAFLNGLWVGILLAAHWLTFFFSIKVSNVSVTLGCLGASTLFTAIFEPLTDKKKVSIRDIVAGVIIILGIYLIFRFEFRYVEGIIFAVISALLSSVFSVFNKHLSYRYDYRRLAFSELISACIITVIVLLIAGSDPISQAGSMSVNDLIYLIILGSIGTAFAYTATISIIKKLNAYSVILAINLEPVYGILLARWIFGESELMSDGFYLGAAIILVTVVLYSLGKKKDDKAVQRTI